MIQPRLTCPSVWYKRLLLSRTHVEESYSHALRRWAGYQRFLLQTDEGKSIEPFLRMLEALISDAEERADAIDNVVQAAGDSEAGVLRRIGQYDSLYFKPRRDRLIKRAASLKKTNPPDVPDTTENQDQITKEPQTESRPSSQGEAKIGYDECNSTAKESVHSTQLTEELKDAWIRLLQERTRYLAESLTEFAALLNSNPDNRDQDYYEKLFDACALETAREELQPLWLEDFNHHLYGLPDAEETESPEMDSVSDQQKVPPRKKQPPRDPVEKGLPVSVSLTEDKDMYQPRVDAHNRKWRSTNLTSNRNPAPLNTFTVLPVIKRFGARWSDMGTSSAPMTPRSRLNLVRKYIKRSGSQKTLDGSENDKTSSLDVRDSRSRQSKEQDTSEPVNTQVVVTRELETNCTNLVSTSSKTNLPSISERQHFQGSVIKASGLYQITDSYNKDFSLPSSRRDAKFEKKMRLPKLLPDHSGLMRGSKLPPIRRKAQVFAEQQTLPIQKPCPFNSESLLQRNKKYG